MYNTENITAEGYCFFSSLTIYQIVVNPRVKGYPPLFLLCKSQGESAQNEFAIGTSYLLLNQLLMKKVPNTPRIAIAERLADSIIGNRNTETLSIESIIGSPLKIAGLKAMARKYHFQSEGANASPLSFYRFSTL